MDMLVPLMPLEYVPDRKLQAAGFVVRRAHITDKTQILEFVRKQFPTSHPAWSSECEFALMQSPPTCFIASKDNQIVGFACYNATGKGFFGPLGVESEYRGRHLGRELLLIGLDGLKHDGYAYGIIGWVSSADFYEQHVSALPIPNSEPHNSIYHNALAGRIEL